MDPEEIVSGGGGWGKEYAELRKHVLPAGLYLIAITLIVLVLLINSWPQCESDGCEEAGAKPPVKELSRAESTQKPGSGTEARTAVEGTSRSSAETPVESPPEMSEENPPGEPKENQPEEPEESQEIEPAETPEIEISTLEPTSGTIFGGTPVTITGSGFSQGVPEVRFGGLRADLKSQDGGTSLVVATPCHWEGPVDVAVEIKEKSGKVAKGFNYFCPERNQSRLLLLVVLAGILGGTLHAMRSLFWFTGNRNLRVSWLWMYYLLPLSGAAIGTIFFLVFIAGFFSPEGASSQSYFVMVGVAALVGMFSAQAVEKLKKISEAILTSVPPAADKTPKPLTLTEVKPSTGPTTGRTSVTLTGTGFVAGATVTFGDAPATDVKVTSTQIDAVTPPHDAGKVDVDVCNPDSGITKKAAAFEYLGPLALTTIAPPTGPSTGGTPVILTGSGFASGATVTFDGIAAADVKVTNARIDAVTPPHVADKVDVEARNPDGGTAKLAAGFEYLEVAAAPAGGDSEPVEAEGGQAPATPPTPPEQEQ